MTDLRKAAELTLEALDVAQAMLEKSRHYNQILGAYKALRQALAQPEQEPVALKVVKGEICFKSQNDDQSFGMWCSVDHNIEHEFAENTKFYTAQPKREWQGLTDEEISLMAHNDDEGDWSDLRLRSCWHEGYLEGARSAEAKLREKNT